MTIAEKLQRVQERIALAAERAGRRAGDITLVGVTKYVGVAEAAELVSAGCFNLGESRPQELWEKHVELERMWGSAASPPVVRWHLIGHLQRNKVARTLPLVSLIHSVDSERLLAAIDAERAKACGTGEPMDVLLEVNTSGEAAKHGLAPAEVEPLILAAQRYLRVRVRGLMTMAALEGGEAAAARCFAALRELRDRVSGNVPSGVTLTELSMGMSGDFEIAIREGATLVRVGSLLWE
ncbi:MAG: YggS family pyridoxal phosphate-dependent enzyme [Pirellulales bacterium]|nr:YggS family pyridoxal phosphate-dependent enzyme [Pirellulales bacterium]